LILIVTVNFFVLTRRLLRHLQPQLLSLCVA